MTLRQELAKLKRINIDEVPEQRLRSQLREIIPRLEDSALEVTKELQATNSKLALTVRQLGEERQQIEALQREVAELRAAASTGPQISDDFMAFGTDRDRQKFVELNIDLKAKELELQASKVTIDTLRDQLGKVSSGAQMVRPRDILSAFGADIERANKEIPSGFEIADIEVDVKGAIGKDGDDMVLGLDASRLVDSETATRLRFTLRRVATIKTVE